MGDWDEFGDGSDFSDTTETLDSFDESSFETAESIDVSSIMDTVEPIESDMDFSESSLDMDDTASVDYVMDSAEAVPAEFNDMPADEQMQEVPNAETDIQENVESIDDSYEIDLADSNVLSSMNETEVPQIEFDEEPNEIRPIDELGTWLEEINPDFDPFDIDSPYCNNCGSCAYAVYQRLEGNNDICATDENIGYNDEMEALTGMEQVSMSPAEIEARLLEQGDGSHAIIGIDRSVGPGHWFNAANIGGKVVAIDGQTGEINDWPPDYGDVVNWDMSVKKES